MTLPILHKYIIFLQSDSYLCIPFRNIRKKFREKNIRVIFSKELYNIKKDYLKNCMFDDLEIPKFGELYIMFDIIPQSTVINYYSYSIYDYKLKYYTHNFLMFLAQSLGAKEISWEYQSKNKSKSIMEVENKISIPQTVNQKAGVSIEKSSSNEIKNHTVINYDNNGSELYFQTLIKRNNWVYDMFSEEDKKKLEEKGINKNILHYITSKKIVEIFLKGHHYFNYEYYIKNEFLVDFVRKRQSGMTFIQQEVLFFNRHKSMYDYFLNVGSSLFGGIKSKYKTIDIETNTDKNIYEIKFYTTEELEKTTINNIFYDKNIHQLKQDILNEFIPIKDIIKDEYKIDIKGTDIYSNILQKLKLYYKLYREYINDNQLYNYIKGLLYSHNDEMTGVYFTTDKEIDTFLSNIPQSFFIFICEKIMNSHMSTTMFYTLVNDIKKLVSKYPDPVRFLNINFVKESAFYESEVDEKILSKIKDFQEYNNIQNKFEEEKREELYKLKTKIELINKPEGNNYANCSGIYIKDENTIVNKHPVFISSDNSRFIGKAGSSWVLTGTQWLEEIVNNSKDKEHNFGGFHQSINTTNVIALSQWSEYDVIIKD